MKLKKFLPLVLTATMALTTLAGCGGASQATADNTSSNGGDTQKTTITFWHSMGGVNGEALTHLVDKFNNENDKGIFVDAQYQGEYDDSINKLKSAQPVSYTHLILLKHKAKLYRKSKN